MSQKLLTLLILNGLQRALEIKSFICFSLDVVRDNLALLHNFELLGNAVADISPLRLINFYGFFHVWDLWAGPVDILCPKMAMIIFFDYGLNQDFRFGPVDLANLHQVTTAYCSHYICWVHRVCILLVVFLSPNDIIFE